MNRIRAYTLAELMMVVLIIGILSSIAVPNLLRAGLKGKESALKADLKLYRAAVEMFRTDTGAYPAAISDLAVTTAPGSGKDSSGNPKAITATDWKGPYVPSIDTDPVSGLAFTYSVASGTVGRVTSSATGTALDGTLYSTW